MLESVTRRKRKARYEMDTFLASKIDVFISTWRKVEKGYAEKR